MKPQQLIKRYGSQYAVAKAFGVTRAAVSKHMAALKDLGLDLFSLTGKGYRLAVPMALYDEGRLQAEAPMAPVHCFPVIDSTNQYLLERVNTGGTVFLTHARVAGRYAIRLAIGGAITERRHVMAAWQTIAASVP